MDLVARGEIDPEPLVAGDRSRWRTQPSVYERLQAGSCCRVSASSSSTPSRSQVDAAVHAGAHLARPVAAGQSRSTAARRRDRRLTAARVRVGFIGAGNYASSMLLPHLAGAGGRRAGAGGDPPLAVSRQRPAQVRVPRPPAPIAEAVRRRLDIDAVFIVTRHSSHADLTCRALEAGKAVFVEKPLALSDDELERILATVDETGNDRLMVGFNRRFSPLLVEMRARFGRSTEPTIARYLVNAGRLASDSWYRDNELEGSRFVGEGGHFVDTMSWWIGSDPVEVMTTAAGGPDDLQVSLRYGDGSLATITYLTQRAPALSQGDLRGLERGAHGPARQLQAGHGLVGRTARVRRRLGAAGQGSAAEIEAFLESVRTGGPMPISLDSLVATTRATLAAAVSAVANGAPQQL